ncbi:MAG: dTDP-4-dehydrorhamnose reductase [Betaproteobacteria bacterium]|nr:dTDP-4-dehydrorhamnose reductase [Betaproteobacteria bacterium]MDH5220474.1 dTDP-4-dehydrorhamnose reductase [Betaproteobacteria bacterium]MDH5350175.1 dTDP-4-dehydrorhamnose reductase [Betaproteobacteria bacterium]
MKILLTGATGQVGWELRKTLAPLGEVKAFDRFGLDLADAPTVVASVRALQPDVIVNAAAYTAVDKAETERDAAFAVNATAPRVLAEEARRSGALLVHYSTDYVFDGEKPAPYVEADATNPINVYGASKLAGERAVAAAGGRYLILRTCWVYGPRGKNFYLTMLRLAKERPELHVVNDQVGAPTSSLSIARATVQLLQQDAQGLYHMAAAGETSWCGFARAILKGAGLATPVHAIGTKDYPTPARRPRNSRLDCSKLRREHGVALPPWEEQLAEVTLAAP